MRGFLFHRIAGDDAAEADEEIDFAGRLEIGDAIADHDGGFGQHRVFPLADDLWFAAVAGGGEVGTISGVVAIGIVMDGHGFDEGNAEVACQWFDQWGEAATENDDGPVVVAQGLQGLGRAGDDGFDVALRDGIAGGFVGTQDVHAAWEDFVQGNLAIHRGIGQGDDFLEKGIAAFAREFIDALDAGQRGVTIEERDFPTLAGGWFDKDLGIERGEVEEFDDVDVRQTNAAMARGNADEFLLVGAVDVDAALQRIFILRVHAIESQDARSDEISLRGIAGRPECHGFALLKNRAEWLFVADFFTDAELSRRRAIAVFREAHALRSRGNGILANHFITVRQSEPLVIDRDVDVHGKGVTVQGTSVWLVSAALRHFTSKSSCFWVRSFLVC